MLKISKLLIFGVGLLIAFTYTSLTVAGDGDPECDPGQTYSGGVGSCLDCEPGRYNPTGVGACIPCDVGTFQADAGSRTCNLCEPGTFTSFTNSIECSACPAGWESGPGASECYKVGGRSSSVAEGKFLTEGNTTKTANNDPEAPLTSYTLSDSEKDLVSNVIDKIKILMQLNRASDSVYEKTITLLEGYLSEFASQGDSKKVALAQELLTLLKSLFGK